MSDVRIGGVLALAVASLTAAGCGDVVPPIPLPDAGPPIDAPIVDYTDSDADGLCDHTELSRGTDPQVPDTDGDGMTDRVELEFGFQPTRTDSPEREILISIDQALGATARVPISAVVRGEGENYSGAFQPLRAAGELDAASFYSRSMAVAAQPRQNVFEVVPEEARFVGVSGQTELHFEIELETPSIEPRDCLRGYPWRYNIKRSDGVLVFARRYLLVVGPDDAEWCVPQGLCI